MNKPVLTLFHGWGYTPALWQALMACLEDFDCRAPRLQAPSADISEWADAVAADLPPGGYVLGWSLGAMLAWSVAARHPTKVGGLILMAGSPCLYNHAGWEKGLALETIEKFRQGFRQSPSHTMRRFLALQLQGDAHAQRIRPLLEAALCDTDQTDGQLENGLATLFSTDLRDLDLPADLPLLLIHGRHDEIIPAAGSEWLAAHIPGARLLILEDAGHAPLLGEPARLAELIRGIHEAI